MTYQLSDEDKEKLKEIFNETPVEAFKRELFWQKKPKQEYKPLKPVCAICSQKADIYDLEAKLFYCIQCFDY